MSSEDAVSVKIVSALNRELSSITSNLGKTKSERAKASAARRDRATTVAAKALCQLHGPIPDCWCKGNKKDCKADVIWNELASATIMGLERAGFLGFGAAIESEDPIPKE